MAKAGRRSTGKRSKTRKAVAEPAIKKTRRASPKARRYRAPKIVLTEAAAPPDVNMEDYRMNSATIAFAIVKLSEIISDEFKMLETGRLGRTPSKRGVSAEEESDNPQQSPKSRFDVMKYRSPSPPKRTAKRKGSTRTLKHDSESSTSMKRSSSARSRSGNRRRRSRTASSSSGAGSRKRRADECQSESGRELVKRPRGILKFRKGPYPGPTGGAKTHKIKFSKNVETRFYYCNLTKAKRYNRYRHN